MVRTILIAGACALIASGVTGLASYRSPEGASSNPWARSEAVSVAYAGMPTYRHRSRHRGLSGEQRRIAAMVAREARRQGVDPRVALKIAYIESRFRSVCGPRTRYGRACGPLQVIRKSAERLSPGSGRHLLNPSIGVRVGVAHMAEAIRKGARTPEQIAAYHVGGELYPVNGYARRYVAMFDRAPVVQVRDGWISRGNGSLNVASLSVGGY